MTATYTNTLPTSRDWVRFQIADRDTSSAVLQDEEIDAILASVANKWIAAADCGEIILARHKGATSKRVSNVSLSYGDGKESSYRAHLERLRALGNQKLLASDGKSGFLRVV